MKDYSRCLRAADYYIGDCPLDRARRLIAAHHYAAGAGNTAVDVHGLYRAVDDALCGVAWWQPPTRGAASSFYPDPTKVLALSRLVIVPDVPKNAATFLLTRSAKKITAATWPCLITYADTMMDHTGHIYRAAGWEYLGMTKPEAAYKIDGRLVSRKAGPKTRTHAEMLALGAEYLGKFSKHRFRLVRKFQVRKKSVDPDLFLTAQPARLS